MKGNSPVCKWVWNLGLELTSLRRQRHSRTFWDLSGAQDGDKSQEVPLYGSQHGIVFPTGLIFYSGRSHGISNHHECSAPEGRGFLVLWVQNRIWRIGILLPTCWVPSLHRERASFNNAPFPLRTGSFGWVRGYQDQCLAPAFPRFKYCNSSTETFCKSQNMWISQKKKNSC